MQSMVACVFVQVWAFAECSFPTDVLAKEKNRRRSRVFLKEGISLLYLWLSYCLVCSKTRD